MVFKRCFRALDGHSFEYSYIKGIAASVCTCWRVSICAEAYIYPFYCFCDFRRGFFGIAIVAHSTVLDITFLPLFSTLIVY